MTVKGFLILAAVLAASICVFAVFTGLIFKLLGVLAALAVVAVVISLVTGGWQLPEYKSTVRVGAVTVIAFLALWMFIQ